MESITSSAEDFLVDSLSFKLPGSGQYVQERRSVTFHTEGSNSYSSLGGTRVIRFKLASEGWLDPSTARFFFDVVNDGRNGGAKALRPIGAVHGFFRRLRVTMRGVVIEDISDYNRVHEMFNVLQTTGARANDRAEGFGGHLDIKSLNTVALLPGIDTLQTVCFKPLCGLFMQTKYIPLRYCPLEIELELADVLDPIVSVVTTAFTAANTSCVWKLENCMMKVDLCTLDNALGNNYVTHLLSGKSLNIVYNTFISNIQTILSEDTQINVSRSLSKLKCFITLGKDFAGQRLTYYYKQWNNFIRLWRLTPSPPPPPPTSQRMTSNPYSYKSEPS